MGCQYEFEIGVNENGTRYTKMRCGNNGWLCPACARTITAERDELKTENARLLLMLEDTKEECHECEKADGCIESPDSIHCACGCPPMVCLLKERDELLKVVADAHAEAATLQRKLEAAKKNFEEALSYANSKTMDDCDSVFAVREICEHALRQIEGGE